MKDAPKQVPPSPPDRGIQWFRAWDHSADKPATWKYEDGDDGRETPYTDKAVQLITEMPGGKLVPRKEPPWSDKVYFPAADRDDEGEYTGSPASVPQTDFPCRWNQRALRWEVVATPATSQLLVRITDANRETGTYSWKELEWSSGWGVKTGGQSGTAGQSDEAVESHGSQWVLVGAQVLLQRVGAKYVFAYDGGCVFGGFSRFDQMLGYFYAPGSQEEIEFDSEFPEVPELTQSDVLGFAYSTIEGRWKLIAQQCATP